MSQHKNEATAAASPDSQLLPGEPVFRRIDPKRLLPPLNPSRETFGDEEMQDLLTSIPVVGIIEPLVVEQEGERFRIMAGHRRWVAATALELAEVPCMVYAPGTAQRAAIQHHENKARESVNPAHEARYFGRLLETECSGDVDKLCELTRESRQYLEGRLLLLEGWPEVMEALSQNFISMGVATELNRIDDDASMRMYLDAAARGGATVRTVREWRIQWERTKVFSTAVAADQPLEGAAVHIVPQSTMVCFLCDHDDDPHAMELLWAHKTCRRMLLDRFLDSIKVQPTAEG
jgi:ParB/RepB/Spo0J family partition protein